MAIYVPESTRRRRLIGIAGACLIVGFVAGGAIGRATSPGVGDAEAEVRDQAQDAITALQRMPIEYEQALADEGGEDTSTITAALERARSELDAAYAAIDVFGPEVREGTDASFDALVEDISDAVPLGDFEQAITAAIAQIRATFGLSTEVPPE